MELDELQKRIGDLIERYEKELNTPKVQYPGRESFTYLLNAIVCRSCGTAAVSFEPHQFRYCKCRRVATEGGIERPRHIGDPNDYFNLTCVLYAGQIRLFSEVAPCRTK